MRSRRAMGPRAERAREETNLPEPETIPAAKKSYRGQLWTAAGLAGSVGDTSPASTSVVKSLRDSESDCAVIVDYLPEEPRSSMSAVGKCPKKQQNLSQNV